MKKSFRHSFRLFFVGIGTSVCMLSQGLAQQTTTQTAPNDTLLPAEAHTPVTFPVIDQNMITLHEFALQNFNGQGIFDFPLDGPLQRPGAKGRIIAGVNQKTLGLF